MRIDPIERGDCEYEIQSIEFLDAPSAHEIYINAESAPTSTVFSPVYENGVLAAAIDPYASGFYAKLGIFYRWDFDKQALTLYGANDTYIIFTMGSKKAMTDKGEVELKSSLRLVDGIPMIEIDAMAKALDLDLTVDGAVYKLKNHYLTDVDDSEVLDIVWDFNINGYLDDFTTACLEPLDHSGGVASFKSTSNGKRHDPVMNSPAISLSAVKYEKIVVRMAYDVTGGYSEGTTGISSSLFFAAPDVKFDENHVVTVKTEGLSSNGEFVDIEFDMTENPNWTGTIGKVRFDPFEAEGTCSIDSIRIILTNPEGIVHIKPKPTEVVLVAGEKAPEGITYSGENANITVINDPDNQETKVFEVKTTANRRAWSYFNIYMQFEPGKKYKASYRLYPLKDYSGKGYDSNVIGGNFIFGTDGENVSNHTVGNIKTADDAGWQTVSAEFTIPADYKPSAKDCFQFWSNPINDLGVSYLVADIRVELAE